MRIPVKQYNLHIAINERRRRRHARGEADRGDLLQELNVTRPCVDANQKLVNCLVENKIYF